jgi:HIRAN domain
MLSGGLEVGVVGEGHYQDALSAIVGGKGPESVRIPTQATLVPEPDNPYDPNAVAVYIAGRKVGHLPRPAAQAFTPVGRRLAEQRQVGACSATITGGWDRPSRPAAVEQQIMSRFPRRLWRLAQCRPPRSGPVCRPADTVPSCGVARGGMTNRMTVGAAFGHGQHPTTGGAHGAGHRHRRHVLSRPRYRR